MSNRGPFPGIFLLSLAVILVTWGLLTVFNTSSAEIIDRSDTRSIYGVLAKQGAYAFLGGLGALFAWRYGPEWFEKNALWIGCGIVFLLLACFIPGISAPANGAARWIRLGPASFQPSELFKIFIPIFFLAGWRKYPNPTFLQFLAGMGILALPIGLILAEPDNGTALLCTAEVVLLLFLSRMPIKYWLIPLTAVLILGVGVASRMPHVHRRIEIFLHPERDLQGKGHQPYQARIAVGSGGLTGRGLGNSLQKLEYLPEAQNDYIAAIVAEETGFLGIIVLHGLYAAWLLVGIRIALMQKNKFNQTLVLALITLIVAQALVNLAVVCGLLPSKGINLPLFSQGGTSLLCYLFCTGWILHFALPSRKEPLLNPSIK